MKRKQLNARMIERVDVDGYTLETEMYEINGGYLDENM